MALRGRHPEKATALLARASVALLALAIVLEPVSARAVTSTNTSTSSSGNTSSWTAPAPAPANQAGAQQNAGNANSLASMLSTGVSVLSMAAGGLAMASGASQLACCSQGCPPGAGFMSSLSFLNIGNKAKQATPAVGSTSGTTTPSSTSASSAPASGGASCYLDGSLALATGGLMMLNGIMGLAAAKQAGQNAGSSYANSGGMDSYSDLGGTSPTGSSVNNDSGSTSSKLGAGDGNGGTIKLDPALLRTGTANDIMGQFEHKFGIARDSFAQNVISGEDPRKLLATAPANPLSVSDMNKAINLAQNMTPEQKAAAQSATLNQAQAEMMAKLGPDGGGGGTAARAPAGRYDFNPDENLVSIGSSTATDTSNTPLSDISVSPEVQAALLARQLDESKVDAEKLTLFERVHLKYRDKTKMIFGYDPSGPLKGVGNENGM